jgi:hypothetical protein
MSLRLSRAARAALTLTVGLAPVAFVACGGGTDQLPPDPTPTAIEVAGTWTSNFGGTETITSTVWAGTPVVKFDNTANRAFLRNPDDAMFNPGTFARVVWTEPNAGAFFYCWVDFGLPTLEAAETSTQAADPTAPDVGGCGGFSWTRLSR